MKIKIARQRSERKRRDPFGSVDRRQSQENRGFPELVAQMVATETGDNGCERLKPVAQTDPELARIMVVWPKLSATARRMILAAVETDQEECP